METQLHLLPETTTTHLLEGMEESIALIKTEELKAVIHKAIETLEHLQLDIYADAASELANKTQWNNADDMKARCLVLYHGYLLFYRNEKCLECQAFLSRIRQRYQSAHQLQQAA